MESNSAVTLHFEDLTITNYLFLKDVCNCDEKSPYKRQRIPQAMQIVGPSAKAAKSAKTAKKVLKPLKIAKKAKKC